MAEDPAVHCAREKRRYARFTPEQRAQVIEATRLRMEHRRRTDAEYLAQTRATVRQQYSKHREKRIATMRAKQERTRLACLQAYCAENPFCVCCGESTVEFLTLDHLRSRREDDGIRVGGDRMGQQLYSWLIRTGFPPGFRVLCYNCNCARGTRGYCPHELQLDAEVERLVV